MTNGEKVVAKARSYLGVYEKWGENRGPEIDRWEARWGTRGVAWCGMFIDAMYAEAGVDDEGIMNPSTYYSVENARQAGRLSNTPVTGCAFVWKPGSYGHMEIGIKPAGGGMWWTIGGNTGDAVREHTRSIAGAYIIVPKAILLEPEPVYRTEYGWQDLDAEPVNHGLWAREDYRENAVKKWIAKHGNPGHVRRGKLSVKVNGIFVPRFTFWTGQRARSPWFDTIQRRDRDLEKVKDERPGHRFRTVSRRVRVS